MAIKIKQFVLMLGDALCMYLCLFLALFIRYGMVNKEILDAHLGPFSFIFAAWIIIFYIFGLYDLSHLKNYLKLFEQIIIGIFFGSVLAIIVFYSFPYFKISPRTNLAIFVAVFIAVESLWRILFYSVIKNPQRKVLIIGQGNDVEELKKLITTNPQLGYQVSSHIKDVSIEANEFSKILSENKIDTIIINQNLETNPIIVKEIYKGISSGIEIIDMVTAYENLFKKLPLSEIKDIWVVTNLSKSHNTYEVVKRPLELVASILLFLIISPILILVFLAVKITSKGPSIYKQIRLGKNEKQFYIYKFRTMVNNAEKDGAKWATSGDSRVTGLGKFLRFTHIDELPQLVNIIKGNISFVGPRPERPEFVEQLKKTIPYFDVRHIIKPGLTGWAQVNFKYGSSVEDAYQKLQYDMYYIKRRSFVLDFLVVLKTIKMFLFNF
jgi:exopolysaccharide biosynthesis polyprenyl glycosylphosphotransferase